MELIELVQPTNIFPCLKASSKKQLLQELSDRASTLLQVDSSALFGSLLERERLGSTGMGKGVAIPHCRFEEIPSITGFLARLEKPVDFEAVDGEPVDLVFLLVAPEAAGSDHLKALARVSRLLRDPSMCATLRGASDVAAMHAVLADLQLSRAA